MNTDTDRLEFMLQYEAEVPEGNEKYTCIWYDDACNRCYIVEAGIARYQGSGRSYAATMQVVGQANSLQNF